jgi:AcrR family transcriptional regulator
MSRFVTSGDSVANLRRVDRSATRRIRPPRRQRARRAAGETILAIQLAGNGNRRVEPFDAFVAARRTYLRGRRLDMQELANDLGISRATLYRWVGGREQLLGEILWSLGEMGMKEAEAAATATGPERIVQIYEHFLNLNATHWPLQQFIANEPQTALRLLISNQGTQHQRLIDYLQRLLEDAAAAGEIELRLEAADLAYVLVRIGESYLWREFITGDEPDAAKAATVARVLLA